MGFRGGVFYEARYGFDWDFEGGHFTRFGFEWDFEGGAFYEERYDLGGILLTYQNLLCFNHSTPQNLRIALAER